MTARGYLLGMGLGLLAALFLSSVSGAQNEPESLPTLVCVGGSHDATRSLSRDFQLVEQKNDFAERLVGQCKRLMEQNGYDARFLKVATPAPEQAEAMLRGLAANARSFVGLVATDGAGNPERILYQLPNPEQMDVAQAASAVYAQWSSLLVFVKRPHDFDVTLRADDGRFVSPSEKGKLALECKAPTPDVFTLTDYNGLLLKSGDPITLRSSRGLLVSAEDGGGQKIHANRTEKGAWETLTIRKVGPDSSPVIHSGDQIAIQSMKGDWFSAEHGGGGKVTATGHKVGRWQTFVVEIRSGMSPLVQ